MKTSSARLQRNNFSSSKTSSRRPESLRRFKDVLQRRLENILKMMWRRGVVVFTTAQLHSAKPKLRFCASSNPARGVPEIRDGEDLWQWSQLEIRVNAFRRSTIPQQQFIKASWKTKNCYAEDVLKTCLEDILKTCLEDILKTFQRQIKCFWEYLYLANLNVYLTNLYFTNLYLTNLRRI